MTLKKIKPLDSSSWELEIRQTIHSFPPGAASKLGTFTALQRLKCPLYYLGQFTYSDVDNLMSVYT